MPTIVDRIEVEELLSAGDTQIVEVLSPAAFEALHLPGAVNIPLEELDQDSTRQLDPTRPVVVYCYDYQ